MCEQGVTLGWIHCQHRMYSPKKRSNGLCLRIGSSVYSWRFVDKSLKRAFLVKRIFT
jgi:hypothetical protein